MWYSDQSLIWYIMNHITDIILLVIYFRIGGPYTILRVYLFRPYKNKFMCWYMRRFSRNYRNALVAFLDLVDKRAVFKDVPDDFLLYLERGKKFISSRDTSISINSPTFDNIINQKYPSYVPAEFFTARYGRGSCHHKVIAYFDFGSELYHDIYLKNLQLVYHDENEHGGYLYVIKDITFPKSNGGGGGQNYIPDPEPVLQGAN